MGNITLLCMLIGIMNEMEQRYHSNKQEFLALKWAVTEQFHEYLSPYGKNRNEFVVRTDNNPLTYIFSTANLGCCRAEVGSPPCQLQLHPRVPEG